MVKKRSFDPKAAAESYLSKGLPAQPSEEGEEKLIQRSFYLTRKQAREFKALAAREGKDMSALIRELIDTYMQNTK